jgi:hypothetical protein
MSRAGPDFQGEREIAVNKDGIDGLTIVNTWFLLLKSETAPRNKKKTVTADPFGTSTQRIN